MTQVAPHLIQRWGGRTTLPIAAIGFLLFIISLLVVSCLSSGLSEAILLGFGLSVDFGTFHHSDHSSFFSDFFPDAFGFQRSGGAKNSPVMIIVVVQLVTVISGLLGGEPKYAVNSAVLYSDCIHCILPFCLAVL